MTIITLTSDFGLIDPYVGIMKGVIFGIAPDVRLVDLTHEIPPQDIEEAAYRGPERSCPTFPREPSISSSSIPALGALGGRSWSRANTATSSVPITASSRSS